jgi:hypothetical protein
MSQNSQFDQKIKLIQSHFAPFVGRRLVGYETAEILLLDNSWNPWPDLPIRLQFDGEDFVAVVWSRYDNLWITTDFSLPFSPEDSTIRWVPNSIDILNSAINRTICSILIGRGQMSIEGREIEIWTRLLIQVDDCWLEIFNNLDENGYHFHTEMPGGTFIRCL